MKINKVNLAGAFFSAVVLGTCISSNSAIGVLINGLCVALNLWLGYEGETK